MTIGANSLELFETSKESERTNGERSHSAMRENSTVYGHSDRTYATSRAYDRSPRKENTFQGLGIKDSSERSRFTFHVLRISNIIQKQLLCLCPFDEAEDSNPIGFEIGIYLKRPCILPMKTIPLGASDRTTLSKRRGCTRLSAVLIATRAPSWKLGEKENDLAFSVNDSHERVVHVTLRIDRFERVLLAAKHGSFDRYRIPPFSLFSLFLNASCRLLFF